MSCFYEMWECYTKCSKIQTVSEKMKRAEKFLEEFKASKKDTILFKRIMTTLEGLGFDVKREDEWLYFAEVGSKEFYFMPSECGKGFNFAAQFAPIELIPYGSNCMFIHMKLVHLFEFNEAYRDKYQKEIKVMSDILYCPNSECSDPFNVIIEGEDCYFVICHTCGTSGPKLKKKEDAIDVWNHIKRRPLEYKNEVSLDIDLDQETIFYLSLMAHKKNVTLNDFIIGVLLKHSKEELSKQKS
jgi:hypothetical protein